MPSDKAVLHPTPSSRSSRDGSQTQPGALSSGNFDRLSRAARPVMRLHHFRSVEFALANIGNVLVNFAGFAVLLLAPYWLVRHGGASTGWSGFLLASSPAASMAAALVAGRMAGRVTPHALAALGALLTGAGLLLVAQWGRDGGLGLVILALALHGAGLGLFQLAFTDMVTGAMPREDRGVAGSLAMMTRTLGVVSAASLLSLMHRHFEEGGLATGLPPEEAFVRAFAAVFGTVGLIPLGVAALWLLRGVRRG